MSDRPPATSRSLPQLEGPDEARLRTWLQLVRTFYRAQRRLVSTLAEYDMTLPQFELLAVLRFDEGITQQELAERLLVTKGNVCGVLNRLEGLGWVARQPDAHDGRANRLHLTAAGRKKVEAVLPKHDAWVIEMMSELSAADVKSLRRMLEELDRASDCEP